MGLSLFYMFNSTANMTLIDIKNVLSFTCRSQFKLVSEIFWYIPAFWHDKMFQENFEHLLSQTWNQSFLKGAVITFSR